MESVHHPGGQEVQFLSSVVVLIFTPNFDITFSKLFFIVSWLFIILSWLFTILSLQLKDTFGTIIGPFTPSSQNSEVYGKWIDNNKYCNFKYLIMLNYNKID